MEMRLAKVRRETKETTISVQVNIDGSGIHEIRTGYRMFDHLLSQLALHGLFDLKISATGANVHHIIEDVAIGLGRAFNKALGERQGIVRMGHALVPMDEALAMVAVDIGGRGYTVAEIGLSDEKIEELPGDIVRHFLEAFAYEARLNLHCKMERGLNAHHKAEALFKALGRALDIATRRDERLAGRIPSTKEVIEGG